MESGNCTGTHARKLYVYFFIYGMQLACDAVIMILFFIIITVHMKYLAEEGNKITAV